MNDCRLTKLTSFQFQDTSQSLHFSVTNHKRPNQDFNTAIKMKHRGNLPLWVYSVRLEWIILDNVHWPDLLTDSLLLKLVL